MSEDEFTVLVVGATGSIGRLVVEESLRRGYRTRALVRNEAKCSELPSAAEIAIGQLTQADTLNEAVKGIDAVVFTHGSDGESPEASEAVDYGGVRNVLFALGDNPARVALMTSIGVTNRKSPYPGANESHDWKRRSERLVRSSGRKYTVVRPGWFDYNKDDQLQLSFRQGDRLHDGKPSDGVVSRKQVAEVLVSSLTSDAADHKTLELDSEKGSAQSDLEPIFAALKADVSINGVDDLDNMDTKDEPHHVREDLNHVRL